MLIYTLKSCVSFSNPLERIVDFMKRITEGGSISPLNVQFGSGGNQLAGWENHDIETDVTKLPLPYGDNTVDTVLAEHLVEHTAGPDCFRFFRDVHRILKPGGIFRVCIPTVERIFDREQAIDLIINHGHLQLFCRETLHQMLWAAGFDRRWDSGRKEIDGHHREIGMEKDDRETVRVEAMK